MVKVLNSTALITFFSTVSNAKAPQNVEDYVAKFGKLLGERQQSIQKAEEKPEHEMWNLLKRSVMQSMIDESKSEKLKSALQHKLEDKFLNELGLGTEYKKRGISSENALDLVNSRLQPGLFKKAVGESTGESFKNLNLDRFSELLGALKSSDGGDNQKRAMWKSNMNALFKKDGSDTEAGKHIGNIEIYKKNDAYYPIFKRSDQDSYYPIFKRSGGFFPIF